MKDPLTLVNNRITSNRNRRRHSRSIIVLLIVLAVGSAACSARPSTRSSASPNQSSTKSVGPTGTVTYADFTPLVEGFDPALAQPAQFVYLEPIYNTLVHLGPGGVASPELATSWHFNSATELTLTLRTGVKFTNGEAFNSSVVKANLERDITLGGPEAAYLSSIKAIDISGPNNVIIHFNKPDSSILAMLGGVIGMMAAPNAFSNIKTDPVGTGGWIYSATNSVPGARYTYISNPHYWDPSQVRFHEIEIEVISNETTIANALKARQVDMGAILPVDATSVANSGLKISDVNAGTAQIGILDLNGQLTPALGRLQVREAIEYAINRSAIVKTLMYGYGVPTDQYYPSNFWGFNSSVSNEYPYNPKKAKALLLSAGYPNGFTTSIVTLSPFITQIEAVQAELALVGIRLHIVVAPPGQLLHYMESGHYSLWSDWGTPNGSNSSPEIPLLDAYARNGEANPFKITPSGLLALMAKGESETTIKTMAPTFKTIDAIMTKNVYDINIAINEVPFAYNPAAVSNLRVSTVGVVTVPEFYGLNA